MLLFMMYYTNGKNGSALGVRVYAIVGQQRARITSAPYVWSLPMFFSKVSNEK